MGGHHQNVLLGGMNRMVHARGCRWRCWGVPGTPRGSVRSLPHGSLTVASLLMRRGFPQSKCPRTARRKLHGLCSPRLTLLSVGSLRGAQLKGKRQRPHFPTGGELKNLQTCFKSTIALGVFVRGWDGWTSTYPTPSFLPPSPAPPRPQHF